VRWAKAVVTFDDVSETIVMADPIRFTVIIPTYGRPTELRTCLEAVARLDYLPDFFEVLVVDDGSSMPPEGVVREFQGRIDVRLVAAAHGGPAAARNAGAAQARNKYLAFTDDDCTPSADWLRSLAARLEGAPDSAIGGRAVNALARNPYSEASQVLLDYLYSHFNGQQGAASFIGAANICVPAEGFRDVGGFNAAFRFAAEDREFCDRWLHTGHRMMYAPEVVVYHAHSLTLRTYWQQQFSYARGGPQVRKLQAGRGRSGVGRQPLSFYVNLLRYPFLRRSKREALRLSILLAVSQVATVVGFYWETIASHIRPARVGS
jgi:GT2 family glycosyltransferase